MPLVPSGNALFAGSAAEFITMAPASTLTAHLTLEFKRRYGRVNDSEVRSWRNSLKALAGVVESAGLVEAGVGVELRLPSSSRRIDASLIGRSRTGEAGVVLVELKQWETAGPSMAPDNVMVGGQEKLHPSVQVAAYADYLRESHSAFTEDGFQLAACAYLHNMADSAAHGIRGIEYRGAMGEAPFFVKGEEDRLAQLLSVRLEGGGGVELLPNLVSGRYSPSKKLIDGIARSLKESPVWTLIDDQRLAFNIIRGQVEIAAKTGDKSVIIITGGPGTGKSVIAAHLVIGLAKEGAYRTAHATGSKAFTTNLRALGGSSASAVFRYTMNFAHKTTDENGLDVLVIDEAHRVRKTSNQRFTPKALKSELSQTEELMRAARVSVFLLDERQNVRPDEIGNVAEIEAVAKEMGLPVTTIPLRGQFRCNGSDAYIDWIDQLFSEDPLPVGSWAEDGEYDLRLFDSPAQMEKDLHAELTKGNTGRLVAGFCWPWSDPEPGMDLPPDVKIGGWERPWNEKPPEQQKGKKPAPAPSRHPYTLWATQEKGLGEVGCIYSAQGFEFDYAGVILGNDLVWRSSVGWIASKDASSDTVVRRVPGDRLKQLIQHTYRVLLTRGMKGTFVYSTDYETRQFLRGLIQPD